jgi:hypothetical protein
LKLLRKPEQVPIYRHFGGNGQSLPLREAQGKL